VVGTVVSLRRLRVPERPGTLAWNVLPEGPAHCDVHQLNAPADSQHWESVRSRIAEDREFEDVTLRIDVAKVGVRRLAVMGGIDVLAAAQHQTVQPVEQHRVVLDPEQG
jgi:hypothetical protein